MTGLRDTAEFAFGDRTQRAWADELARAGRSVLPTHAFDEVVPETRAPMMVSPRGLLVTPDVLTFNPKGQIAWHEVKGKTEPTWRKFRPGPRWEHGFDYSLLAEYRDVQSTTGTRVFIVVGESRSPISEDSDELGPPGPWLYVSLNDVQEHGEYRETWPGGASEPWRRGRDGKGGLLWARRIMREWRPRCGS